MTSEYDKTMVYDTELKPIVDSLMRICRREKMPFFLSVMVKSTGGEKENTPEYRREAIIKEMFGYDIPNDEIGSHLAIAQGYKVDFAPETIEIGEADDEEIWDMTEEEFWDE